MTRWPYEDLPEEVLPAGRPETRTAVARWLGVERDAVAITAGGSPAVLSAMFHALGSADRRVVMLPRPWYPQYPTACALLGCETVTYSVGWDGCIDGEALGDAIRQERPSVVIVNSPHNPTGSEVDSAALASALDATAEVGARMVLDETFAGLGSVTPWRASPIVAPGLVRVASLGKTLLALADARVGYVVGIPSEVEEVAVIHRTVAVGAAVESQRLVCRVLREADRQLGAMSAVIAQNAERARSARDLDIRLPACGIFGRVMLGDDDDPIAFARLVRDIGGFWCNPSEVHGMEREKWIRLRLAIDPRSFDARIEAIRKARPRSARRLGVATTRGGQHD